MNDPTIPTIFIELDEADPDARVQVGVDAAGEPVWQRFRPYHAGPQQIADVIAAVAASGRSRPRLDAASARAAGAAYANRPIWVESETLTREEAIRMAREAIETARVRAWASRRTGGKSNAIAALLAEHPEWERRPAYVVDPKQYLTNVTWAGESLVDRIDRVVAEAEALVASVRAAQRRDRERERNRDDMRRMFGWRR